MSLGNDVRPAVRAVDRRPALLAVGATIWLVQFGLVVAGSALAEIALGGLGRFIAPVVSGVLVLFTLPLYAGIYAPATAQPVGAQRTVGRAVEAVRRTYRSLLVADLVATVVACVLGFTVVLLWLVVSTGVRYARYALADPGLPYAMESVYLAAASLGLGITLGGLAVRFADTFVLFEDVPPRRAWRSSLRFARQQPLSLLGFGVAVAVLHAGPGLASGFVGRTLFSGWFADVLGGFVAVTLGSVGLTLAATLQAVYFERTVAPAVTSGSKAKSEAASENQTGTRWLRVATVCVLVVAAVGGSVAVRTADVRPVEHEPEALPDEPTAAYEVAASNTVNANHRRVVLAANLSDPNATLSPMVRTGVDYRDRQAYVYFTDDSGEMTGSYYAEGTLALRNTYGTWSGLLAYGAGNWSAIAGPGYALAQPRYVLSETVVPNPDANWTVVARNDSTLVFRVDEETAIREANPSASYAGTTGNLTNDSYVEVTVDRERGVVREAVLHLHSLDTGRHFRYVIRFESVGTADLERPDVLGQRTAFEWAWDVFYY